MNKQGKNPPLFGPEGQPLNRPARRALLGIHNRYLKNKLRRGEDIATRRLDTEASALAERSLRIKAAPPSPSARRRARLEAIAPAPSAAPEEATGETEAGPSATLRPARAPGDDLVEAPRG